MPILFVPLLVFAALPFVGSADACINNCQPPVGVCVQDNGCYGGHDVCVSVSTMVPACANKPGITIMRICVEGQAYCPWGQIACVGSVCIRDPCATTNCLPTASRAFLP